MGMIFAIKEENGKTSIFRWNENNPPLMLCGHVAQAIWHSPKELKERDIWTCVICDGKESKVIQNDAMSLTERKARCDYYGKTTRKSECSECRNICNHEKPSSLGLPFFEYKGSDSEVPQELLDNFSNLLREGWDKGYSGLHDPKKPKTFSKELTDKIEVAKQKIYGARKYDKFYCGCHGWD